MLNLLHVFASDLIYYMNFWEYALRLEPVHCTTWVTTNMYVYVLLATGPLQVFTATNDAVVNTECL